MKKYKTYEKCNECQQDNTGENWCNVCNRRRFQMEFDKWTSGNSEIDQFIQQTQFNANNSEEVIEWIPFNRFDKVEFLTKGGFGGVYKAKWRDGYIKLWNLKLKTWHRMSYPYVYVGLKGLDTPDQKLFLQEIKNQLKFRGGWAIAIYGITFHPKENKYMMVMQYANHGSLRNMLNNNFGDLTWINKINILHYVIVGLAKIHEFGLMHTDLHSGNIVCQDIVKSYITDFGLCKPVSEYNREKIYGVIPFMAPETFIRDEYSQKSDIYSFGMIMLEVFTSYPPYYNIPHDENLIMDICYYGRKPEIKCEIPQLLKDLMEKCWDTNPLKRPTAKKLEIQLRKYLEVDYSRHRLKKQIEAIDKANINFTQYDPKITPPKAIRSSSQLPSQATHSSSQLPVQTIVEPYSHDLRLKIPEEYENPEN
ncbi:hypothetical protein Glove_330g122 [Diversispora epigaea]|uniref:Protein kinase domain-containing protein n=1 Tax=Diversispora epigaea TaxID=1348612 RepID=A0A397HK37_9GLOM|nr:hypothetical protein Glove_330g122 [Diversispora epigaea]